MLSRNNKILVGCLALLLVMSVGYALFSDTITINGSATAQGEFDMEIVSASITDEVGSKGATAVISEDGNALSINIPNLEYPGAYVDVTYKLKNTGTINALYKTYTINGYYWTEETKILKEAKVNKVYYAPNEEGEETLRIYWDESMNEGDESLNMELKLSFEQVSDENEACVKLATLKEKIRYCDFYQNDDCFVSDVMGNPLYDINRDDIVDLMDLNMLNLATQNISCHVE